ncbi:hypothetical protein F5148DRAFT_1220714 [Russula earlei]|uniref:Uncharacterized protein n=1 Tax=Russula earlei TaxID=71964 RepID=A0ACC0U1S7_9AGAM|nr:hypothetical protein F5148DRAFT_1220714 [Russula earlei]
MITMCTSTVLTFFCLAVGVAPCSELSSRADRELTPFTREPPRGVVTNASGGNNTNASGGNHDQAIAIEDYLHRVATDIDPTVIAPSRDKENEPEEEQLSRSVSGSRSGSVVPGPSVHGGATRNTRPHRERDVRQRPPSRRLRQDRRGRGRMRDTIRD